MFSQVVWISSRPAKSFGTVNYSEEDKSHPVFTVLAGHLNRCVPMCVYADEGQSRKKTSFMVLATQPVIGKGTLASLKRPGAESEMGANMAGSSLITRFVFSCARSTLYSKKPEVFDKLANELATQLDAGFKDCISVLYGGDEATLYPVVLYTKGDWPILKRLGALNRTHHQAIANLSRSKGVCHLCMTGTEKYPDWHQCHQASWMCPESISDPRPPWSQQTLFTQLFGGKHGFTPGPFPHCAQGGWCRAHGVWIRNSGFLQLRFLLKVCTWSK